MKVACITDDGQTISQHFGRAPYYLVFTIENGVITHREMRDKLGHQHFAGGESHAGHGPTHGTNPASHNRHISMAQAIADCQVLLCRGMGYGAYQSMQQLGIKPIITDVADVEEAVKAYMDGRLQDHPERLH